MIDAAKEKHQMKTSEATTPEKIVSGRVLDPARLYHVAICVRSVADTARYYAEKLGIGPFEFRDVNFATATFHGGPGGYRGKRAFAQLGPVTLELMEHVDGKSIHEGFLADKGEGLHHLGFEVDDLAASVHEAERRGLRVTQGFTREDGSGFAYLDTDAVGGTVFEVVQKMKPKT
jgi:catechol 2,3-dioxygenase-like lactoylglutathione lyase family enzyme